jgi:DNA-3-methyladenine glycosylase
VAQKSISRTFFSRSALDVAPELLNALLIVGNRVGRIVEVEAYGGANDQASHAFRGQTPRNAVMFGAPGHLYVYFTYGMHFCANVVCSPKGEATAVLFRALAPVRGIEEMRAARSRARRDIDLCSGPAKLCEAMSIERSVNGVDLLDRNSPVRLVRDEIDPPRDPFIGVRIGLSERVGDAGRMPLRYAVRDDPNVSK